MFCLETASGSIFSYHGDSSSHNIHIHIRVHIHDRICDDHDEIDIDISIGSCNSILRDPSMEVLSLMTKVGDGDVCDKWQYDDDDDPIL